MRRFLSGNEAVARGAYEAGVKLAVGYPGTPSTEILETLAEEYRSIYSEWSPNEKVAFEVGIGASLGGARALVTMKHVGLNVAADPFMTFAYTGVNGGFVLISADDPEMHSSQNEQDNRFYAKFAQIPFLEPSDSQESKDFVLKAFEISEKFDTPVMLRMTTRISHSKGIIEENEPVKIESVGFKRDMQKYVMIPANAKKRHLIVTQRLEKLQQYSEETELNVIENNGSKIGIISGGIAYQYAKDNLPDADYLKIGFGFPLPIEKIRKFVSSHQKVLVIEELEPYYEEIIHAAGIKIEGKKYFSRLGELSPYKVALGLKEAGLLDKTAGAQIAPAELFPRPPILCPGCPHRGAYMALKKLGVAVTGDIGCYTLGVLPPLEYLDTCICMGASIGNAIGMEKVGGYQKGVVAVIGDSTFLHSGITGLLDAVYNKSNITVIILDNRVTAMTGGQQHPATGYTLMGETTKRVNFIELAKALGVESVHEVDPYDYQGLIKTIEGEINREGPSVIITNRPCVLMPKRIGDRPYRVIAEDCNGCSACFRIGCPAIASSKELTEHNRPKAIIDPVLCTGCSLCAQVCQPEAIVPTGEPVKVK
ncbi:MAG: indolepyruvate ferredoxin oxidoreductase subunit alpha [candidate division Zixibacteria bacterium]|nr:indolepyruvate ferredoxin oxidoreductase subunit alpha [candidate division Zixibacteria bacterium]